MDADGAPAPREELLARLGARHAAAHLERLGYRVLARHGRGSRLRLLAADGETLAVVAVRTRRARDAEPPPRPPGVRVDTVTVLVDDGGALVRLDHLEGG